MPATATRRRLLLFDGYRSIIDQLATEGVLVGYWNARDLNDPNLTQWLRDRSGKGHHMRLGSSGRATIIDGALCLDGTSGAYASTGDSAALSITADIDIRVYAAPDDWTPSAEMDFISKWTPATQQTWALALGTAGTLKLYTSATGATAITHTSTVSVTATDGSPLWIRVTLDVDNGAVGHDVTFYTSTDGINWTQLGAVVTTALTTSLFDSTAGVNIGAENSGVSSRFAGKILAAEIRNGIGGTVVASPDFRSQPTGQTRFTDTQGNVWYLPYAKVFDGALTQPGIATNYAQAPDSAALSITGDITIEGQVTLDDWTPSSSRTVLVKEAASNQRSYGMRISTDGTLEFRFSIDGSAAITASSTAAPTVSDGATLWVRADRVSSTGTVRFYTSTDGVAWTKLGADVVSTAGAIFDSTSIVQLGEVLGGSLMLGKIHRVRIYNSALGNGSGTPVADFNPAQQRNGESAWLDAYGNPWTINSTNTGADTNDPKVLEYAGIGYTYHPGVAANYLSVPDSAPLSITGDIDVRVAVALDDWTPSAINTVLSKWSAAGQRSILFSVLTNGTLDFEWTVDGTNTLGSASSTAPVIHDGGLLLIRATLDVDNGAAGRDIKFYTKATTASTAYADAISDSGWTQLGSTITQATATSIFDSTSVVEIGSAVLGTANLTTGKVYAAVIKSGLAGTTQLAVDTSRAVASSTTFAEQSANGATVTINRSTSLVRKTVVVDRPLFLMGTDDYVEHADHDDFDITATQSLTVGALVRAYGTPGFQSMFAKRASTGVGWELSANSSTPPTGRVIVHDGAAAADAAGIGDIRTGALNSVIGQRDVTADVARIARNGVVEITATDNTTATSANTEPLRIGRRHSVDVKYFDGEGFAFVIIRRALTDAELARLHSELVAA